MREQDASVQKQVLSEVQREGLSAEIHTPGGDPAEGILRVADAVDADLLVVGNRGMTGAKRFVLGSVPNTLAHKCSCSILIVNTDRADSDS